MTRAFRSFQCMAVVVAAALTGACSAPAGPNFDRADVESITRVVKDLETAFNARDAAKAAALYANNAVVMPPNTTMMRGRQFVEQYYIGRFAEGASDLTLDPKDISGFGTIGYASGDYRLTFVSSGGEPDRRDRGKFVWIFREAEGKWLIEYVIFSSDFLAPKAE